MVKKKANTKHVVHKNVESHTKKVHHVKKTVHKVKNKVLVWQILTVVFFLAFILFLILATSGHSNNGILDNNVTDGNIQKIANETVSFLKNDLQINDLKLISTIEENGLYKISIVIKDNNQENNFDLYTSLDGELIFIPGAPVINKTEFLESKTESVDPNTTLASEELQKSDKPIIDLFIMSYCPYGTQVEKGILPVVDLLGDKIDFNLKFVYYSMHGEVEVNEQLLEYCIQKEQPEKLSLYLHCFLEDSNSDRCLIDNNISKDSLQSCIIQSDTKFDIAKNLEDESSYLSGRFPLVNIDKADNDKYNIGGSPTLVVNGTTVSTDSSNRNPQGLLNIICGAFTNQPVECTTELSSATPSPGFGYNETDSSNGGQCS
jgi:hypothetical protein